MIKEGIIQHRGTFAFLLVKEKGDKDVFVRGPSLRLAMNGDTVEVRCRMSGGRPEGEIVRVVKRARKTLVGELKHISGKWWLAPRGGGDAWAEIEEFEAVNPKAGRLAAARVTRWPTLKQGAACIVTELMGRPGEPGARTQAVIRALGISEQFPESVLKEARTFPSSVSSEMCRERLDLRSKSIFTIDGADAKDFDDAVSLEPLGGGRVRLGVHIADVSHYVSAGTELDREANERGTSVYLPGRVIPMLPPNLSDHLCSLMPDVDRLAFSCFIELDGAGNSLGSSFAESVIRSCRRFTYDEVEELLRGKNIANVSGEAAATVRAMGKMAKRLTEKRMNRGALDIDLPEYKIEVDAGGAPVGIHSPERLDSHRLIEEFMILANETVAAFLIERGRPFPSRIHEKPDPDKLSVLQEDFKKLGISVGGRLEGRGSHGVQELLRKIADHPLHDVLGVMVMRSLKQAVYSAKPEGHFGLASRAYCHFTSPIRRYPDLVTHRVLRAELAGGMKSSSKKRKGRGRGRKGAVRADSSDMQAICAHSSERERAAVDAEREVISILRAELMSKRVGQEAAGVVMRSSAYGVFVELAGTGASGLARGAKTRIGSAVRVKIVSVDPDKGEINLEILKTEKEGPGVSEQKTFSRPPAKAVPKHWGGRRRKSGGAGSGGSARRGGFRSKRRKK